MSDGHRTASRRPGALIALWMARYAALLLAGFVVLTRVETTVLRTMLAAAARGILAVVGVEASREGAFVRSDAFAMQVVSACDGTDICLLLGAAILVTAGVSWRRRLTGVALALALTQLLNVGRLVALFAVGVYFPESFEAAHQMFWQVAMMVWAVLFYVRWL